MDLNDARFDFSKDTDLKEKLWAQMMQAAEKKSSRTPVAFDELGDRAKTASTAAYTPAEGKAAAKTTGKSK